MLLLPILLTVFVNKCSTYQPCDGSYCPPLAPKLKINPEDISEPAPIFLGKDKKSGCFCRARSNSFVVCFGRDFCDSVPNQINLTAPMLKLTSTHIKVLRKGNFKKVSHLTGLQIEGNFNLEKILPGTFYNLGKLTNLSISFNSNLKILFRDSFEGLVRLKTLFLIQNAFENVYDISAALKPSLLPNLLQLSLNENNFVNIEKEDFEPMINTSLQELNLVLCRIEYLYPDCLKPFKNLEVLRLGENSFNSTVITEVIEKAVDENIPIKLLNLFSAGFRKNPPKQLLRAIAKTNISSLNLAYNQFEVITSDSFPFMPNLQILDLRNVLALSIANDAFSNLPKLKTLLLSGNKLPSIPNGVLLKNLTYLDLQQNSGNVFSPSYFILKNGEFSNMEQLMYLNLGYNRISHLFNTTFIGLKNLRILGLKNATIYHIANGTFAPLSNLTFLNLENNYFVKNHPNGLRADMFLGLGNLKVLVLSGCSISSLNQFDNPFKHLKSLSHLSLERNQIMYLDPNYFSSLHNLESIDLSSNLLLPWDQNIFQYNKKLQTVRAEKNKFGYLSEAMLEDFSNLKQVTLEDNPFICDCIAYNTFGLWLYSNKNSSILDGVLDKKAFCDFPDSLDNVTLVEYFQGVQNKTFICNLDTFSKNVTVMLPLVLLILFFAALLIFVYYYRWHIRYWIFLTRLYLSRKGKIQPKGGNKSFTNYVYDAFVSYSNEDTNFVIRLVTMLENYDPFLKLCVYERDFEVGSVISDSVLENVAKSRKTLLVISDSYAKSHWCRWESQIAEHHRLFFANENGEYVDDSLVLIRLGPVSENNLTPTLKYLLKTRVYLQWDVNEKKQKVFWNKLRSTLAPEKDQNILENTHM